MNIGAFGENFPYSNFHDLNMDWIIKIAKDFLDQYSNIQQIIETGTETLNNTTDEGVEALNARADQLEALLNEWYETHSNDIAIKLTRAVQEFSLEAQRLAQEASASIPADYSTLSDTVASAISETRNLFNMTNSTIQYNKLIYSRSPTQPQTLDSDGWAITHQLPIEYNKYYSFTGTPNIGAQRGYVFIYDTADNYLGVIHSQYTDKRCTFQNTYENGAYARFNFEISDIAKIMFVEGSIYPDFYIDFGIEAETLHTLESGGKALNDIATAIIRTYEVAVNMFNIDSENNTENKVLAMQSRNVVEIANPSFGYSEPMRVYNNFIYSYYGDPDLGGVSNRVFAYDHNLNFIDYLDGKLDYNHPNVYMVLIANPAIAYIRINYKMNSNVQMFVQGSYPENYHGYKQALLSATDIGNVLYGKKLVTCGDSYTRASFSGEYAQYDGRNYGYYIAQRNNMRFINDGINGSTMTITNPQDPSERSPFAYERYTQVPSDTDYLILWFGINDSAYAELGNINDNSDNTFYGAWNKVLRYYLTNYPFMKIGIIIPTTVDDARFQQAIRNLCEKWGFPYLDLERDTRTPALFDKEGMSQEAQTLRRNAFGFNGPVAGHPSPELYKYESTLIEQFIRGI